MTVWAQNERQDSPRAALRAGAAGASAPASPDEIVELASVLMGASYGVLMLRPGSAPSVVGATAAAREDVSDRDHERWLSALAMRGPLVVLDVAADETFGTDPFLARRGLRFLASLPVVDGAGVTRGLLMIADASPRDSVTDRAMRALTTLAKLASDPGEAFAPPSVGDTSDVAHGDDGAEAIGAAQRFEALTNLIPQIVWSTRPDGYHDYYNDRWYDYTGMPRTGDQGWNWQEYLHPDDKEPTLAVWSQALATGEPYDVRYRFRRASDGEYRWFIGRAMPLRGASGGIARWFGTCTDIHHERLVEQKLARLADFRHSLMNLVEQSLTARSVEDFYGRVLDTAVRVIPGAEAGSMVFRSPDGLFDYVAAVGYDLERLRSVRMTPEQAAFGAGSTPQPVLITDTGSLEIPPRERAVLVSAGRLDEIRQILNIPVVLHGSPAAHLMLDSFQRAESFTEESTEMARIFAGHLAALVQRFRLERQLHRLAYEDTLTGLPNRAAFEQQAAEAFARAREVGGGVGVLFIDLDGFKQVNDRLGHGAGDAILQSAARRLEACSSGAIFVGRLGGDEFVVLLGPEGTEERARAVAERILEGFASPLETSDGIVRLSTSIGIATFPADGGTIESVLRGADLAMYRAKRGKTGYCFARSSHDRASGESGAHE